MTFSTAAFLQRLVLAAALVCIGHVATAQPTGESPAAISARVHDLYERQDYQATWQALLRLHQQHPEAWQDHREIIEETAKALNQRAVDQFRDDRLEAAINATELLLRDDSLELVALLFPEHVEELRDGLLRIKGESFYRMGNRYLNRAEPENAEASFLRALEALPTTHNLYPRLWSELGLIQYRRGFQLFHDRAPGAEAVLRTARTSFEKVIEYAGDNQEIAAFARQNIAAIEQHGLRVIAGHPPPGQEAPTPEPEPEPGFIDRYIPGNLQARATEYWQRFRENPDLQDTVIVIAAAIIAFILLYWVIPNYTLLFIAKNYDVTAAEYKMRVKRWGVFALLGYMLYYVRNRSQLREEKARSGCPHCSYNLEDFGAYEDLVFSRCPKCKGQITPAITLEGYVKHLSTMLATDVERVNKGMESVERFVGKDLMVKMVQAIITLGVRRRASDIHIEPDEEALVVRQRIDGLMSEMFTLPRSMSMALVSAIKVQANLDIAERRVPQDGKLSLVVDKTSIDIRVATSPASAGEKASLRLLDIRSIQLEAKHLGMTPRCQDIFNRTIAAPHGLMLVAGPTGSGKTTTLYVALQQIRPTNRNIISIEDPIEFRIPGVNQIQINPQAGLTFASSLRSVLRQDPDVIMVGEIRDKETAEISVNSASTGHLVLSTLHTIDAASSVARLIDLGVAPRQFADALSLVLAQRLIRLVCQYCPEPTTPSHDILEELEIDPGMVDKFEFRRGKGCHVCNNTGYYRRTGIFEFLVPSERLRAALEHETLTTTEIREIAIQGGMRTLRQEAIALLKKGLTTAEETLRVTK